MFFHSTKRECVAPFIRTYTNVSTTIPERKPNSYWGVVNHQKEVFDNLWKKYDIKNFEDWYSVKLDDVLHLTSLTNFSKQHCIY